MQSRCPRAFTADFVNYWTAQFDRAQRATCSIQNLVTAIDYTKLALKKLALGPFTTAAGYFVKADRAATAQAAELWREAAHMLIQATAPLIKRCISLCMERHHTNLNSRDEEALVERAALRATDLNDAAVIVLRRAECQLYQALWDHGVKESGQTNCERCGAPYKPDVCTRSSSPTHCRYLFIRLTLLRLW